MLSIYDLQDLISISFFDGNINVAGMVLYTAVLLVVFALTRKTTQTLIISLPVTLIFAAIGVLSTDLMVMLIVVTVLALAFSASKIWRSRYGSGRQRIT